MVKAPHYSLVVFGHLGTIFSFSLIIVIHELHCIALHLWWKSIFEESAKNGVDCGYLISFGAMGVLAGTVEVAFYRGFRSWWKLAQCFDGQTWEQW